MDKRSGGGKYGVATVRLTAREVALEDVDSGDRMTFPVVFDVAKGDKSHRAELVRGKKGAVVVFPASEGRAERRTMVYPGFFGYSCNARSTVLYGLTPAENTHLYHFSGFVRLKNDPKQVPVWELHPGFKPEDDPRQEFGANFESADEDEFPGLELRWSYLRYPFFCKTNDAGQEVMSTFLLSDKAGDANKSLYEMLRIGGIIGRDSRTRQEATLVDVPGNLENYLPAVESVLLRNLKGTLLNITSNTKKNEAGRTKVVFSGLSKAVMAAAPKRGKK
jgi:hypothetical protein